MTQPYMYLGAFNCNIRHVGCDEQTVRHLANATTTRPLRAT